MSTMPIYALVDTWSDVATTFKGIALNVTDTASAGASRLFDLQVGGVSDFYVTKLGAVHGKRVFLDIASTNTAIISASNYSLTGSNAQSLLDLAGIWNTTGTPTALKLNMTDTASDVASLLMDLQVGGTSRFKVGKGSLTGSSAVSLVDVAGTWNTSGTPTLVKANVTDTASNAASLLMDLQVGSVSQFKVSKTGNVTLTGNIVVASGKGIDFAATAGAGTSELLSDYEEGTWSPSFNTLTIGNGTLIGRYVKIGRMVFVQAGFIFGSTSSFSGEITSFGNFPFTLANLGVDVYSTGIGVAYKSGIGWYLRYAYALSNNSYAITGSLNTTDPFTWGAGDTVLLSICYEAAA